MSNRLTLSDWALSSQSAPIKERAVIFALRNSNSILARDLRFETKNQMVVNGVRIKELPEVHWRKINETPTGEHTRPEQFSEQAYLIREMVKTDRQLFDDDALLTNPHGNSVQAYVHSIALEFNDRFINGRHTQADKDGLVGIRERLDDPVKYGMTSGNKLNGNGVDLSKAGDADDLSDFVEKLHEALFAVNSPAGDNCVIYMSDELYRRLSAKLSRYSGVGGFSTSNDQFGRTVTMFKGARIETTGFKRDMVTPIISVKEQATGENGNSTFTSCYVVNHGDGYASGWHKTPLSTIDVPDGEGGIFKKTLIEWSGGLFFQSPYSIARLYNIKYS